MEGETFEKGEVSAEKERELPKENSNAGVVEIIPTLRCLVNEHIHTYVIDRSGKVLHAALYGSTMLKSLSGKIVGRDYRNLGIPEAVNDGLVKIFDNAFRGKQFKGKLRTEIDGRRIEVYFETAPLSYGDNTNIDAIVLSLIESRSSGQEASLIEALNRINIELSKAQDIDVLIPWVLAQANDAMGSDGAAVIKKEKSQWRIEQYVGSFQEWPSSIPVHGKDDPLEWAVRTAEPYLASNVLQDKNDRTILIEYGIQSTAIYPLAFGHGVDAVLMHIWTGGPHSFSKEEIEFGKAVSQSLSSAVERAASDRVRDRSIKQLQSIVDGTNTSLILLDKDLRIKLTNRPFDRAHRGDVERLINAPLIDGPLPEEFKADLRKSMATGRPVMHKNVNIPIFVGSENGNTYWDMAFTPLIHGDNVIGAVLSATEVTERVWSESEMSRNNEELSHQHEFLQEIIENAPAAIALISGADGGFRFFNEDFRKMVRAVFGVEDPMGSRLHDMVRNHTPSLQLAEFDALIRSKKKIEISEIEVPSIGGELIYYDVVAAPLDLGGTGVVDILISCTNVTERVVSRKKFESLAKSNELEANRLKTILDTLPVGVAIMDAQGMIIESNKRGGKIWKGSSAKLSSPQGVEKSVGWWADTGILLRPNDWPMSRALREGITIIGEMVDLQRSNGTRGTVLLSASPIKDAENRIVGVVGVCNDVTDQRALEHDALEAMDKAEMYLDLLTHDVNEINREICEHLRSIKEGKNPTERAEALLLAQGSVQDSDDLIAAVKKVKTIESGCISPSAIDLGWVLEDVTRSFPIGQDNLAGIEYKVSMKRYVIANEMVRDIFTSIISFLMKSADRPININIVLSQAFRSGREYYRVSVESDGPGIADEEKAKVFIGRPKRRCTGSTGGFNLFLAKRLVEEFNGKVWVEDLVLGDTTNGSRFVILLPATSAF